MREYVYTTLLRNATIPYTDQGFALVGAAVTAAFNDCVDLGIIARDANGNGIYRVVIPTRASATPVQVSNRTMPPIKYQAQAAGAIHNVLIQGEFILTLEA